MDFFSFSTRGFFFSVTAFGLRSSGLVFDVFVLIFDVWLLFLCYCLWVKSFGFKLRLVIFFYDFFFYFKAYGLTLSGLSFDAFFKIFN